MDEERRIKKHINSENINTKYPLIKRGIDRKDCIKIIKEHGLKVPRKSGCWCCPFMQKNEVRRLFLEEPALYERRKHFEEIISSKREKMFTLSSTRKTVKEMGMENIPPLIKENKKER
jgi:hypothetical protein